MSNISQTIQPQPLTTASDASSALARYTPAIGRSLLALIFIASGLGKIGGWEQTAGYMASKGMPLVPLFLAGAIALELLGGLSILLGYKARIGALALMVFLVPATLIFHAFWTYQGMQQQLQMIQFLKNLSIMGGLLLVLAHGAGPLSLDQRGAREAS
jgi:putative oxidoreductase